MNVRLVLPSLLLLAACGSDDPVTDPDQAASGPTVNAAVEAAEQEMEQAQNRAERLSDAEARGKAAAEDMIRRSDDADTPAARDAAEDNYAIPSPLNE